MQLGSKPWRIKTSLSFFINSPYDIDIGAGAALLPSHKKNKMLRSVFSSHSPSISTSLFFLIPSLKFSSFLAYPIQFTLRHQHNPLSKPLLLLKSFHHSHSLRFEGFSVSPVFSDITGLSLCQLPFPFLSLILCYSKWWFDFQGFDLYYTKFCQFSLFMIEKLEVSLARDSA